MKMLPPSAHPKVSVVIVTYNEKEEFMQCLKSLRRETIHMEIFVVDNASNIDFRAILQEIKAANVRVILNEDNVGLARANNQPMDACSGEYILILNPDTEIKSGSIGMLATYLDAHPDVGVVGPRIFSGDGSVERSFFTTWAPIRAVASGWLKLPLTVASQKRRRVSVNGVQDVLFVSGACLLIRRKLFLELGGYDPSFFLSVEDVVDLCLRARRMGYRVVYYPDATIIHLGARAHKGYGSIFWGYQGRLYFESKHGTPMSALLLRVELFIDCFIETGIMLVTSAFNKRHRIFLLAYTFTAAKLLTRRTNSLYDDGLQLNALLSAKLTQVAVVQRT